MEDYTAEDIADPSAPIGVRREYRWTLGDVTDNDSSLAFYVVHHYAEVFLDGELIYRLVPMDTNRIGKSISSNWVIVPLYPTDSGKEVRVVLTPVYESVRSRPVEFHIGSFYSLYSAQLRSDLPQLLLSAACILLGFFTLVVQAFLIWRKKSQQWSVLYLGSLTMLLGLWKITDTRFSPFLFRQNTMALGYLTIGFLFLGSIALSLYLASRIRGIRTEPLFFLSLIASAAALTALALQVLGIADFKQTLLLAHVVLVLLAVYPLLTALLRRPKSMRTLPRKAWLLEFLFAGGILVDLVLFYRNNSSSGLVFSLLALLVYTLLLFIESLMTINRRAYTDAQTGLFNKARWNALMDHPSPAEEPVGMMMLDLNRLKHTNDTMGHAAGDKMIYTFANILRNTIPSSNTICRWGGDEFTVMVTSANREMLETYLQRISSAVDAYNESGEKPEVAYAAGYALSTDYAHLSRRELLQKADEQMYLHKQQWYREHVSV